MSEAWDRFKQVADRTRPSDYEGTYPDLISRLDPDGKVSTPLTPVPQWLGRFYSISYPKKLDLLSLHQWFHHEICSLHDLMLFYIGPNGHQESDPHDLRSHIRDAVRLADLVAPYCGQDLPDNLRQRGNAFLPGDFKFAIDTLDEIRQWIDDNWYEATISDDAAPQTDQEIPPTDEAAGGELVATSTSGRVELYRLSDEPVAIVDGKEKVSITAPRYKAVKELLRAGETGLSLCELKSKCDGDPLYALRRLRDSDEDWARVIMMAGSAGNGYRIR